MDLPKNTLEPRIRAKHLYWQGWRVPDIAREVGANPNTVQSWKQRDDWDSTPEIKRVEESIAARCQVLIAKDNKTPAEVNEIDVLMRALMRTARIKRYERGESEAVLNPALAKGGKRAARKREKLRKNELSEDQVEALIKAFEASIFPYQRAWLEAGEDNRIRTILKSRQIGATWYFAREALIDALKTGRNQIFLSASKAQAQVFKLYILQFVQDVTGVELKGDPIVLWNGATLYFLGTNARTAQSYHGNVYMDEFFWIPRFTEFRKVASGMAMHKKWRQTYISTPSAISHEAYPFWTGEHFNRGRPKDKHIKLDVSHRALKDGRACEDGQWRQVVTVEDAVAAGCDLFDLAQLRIEYSEDEYRQLLMCEFVDDTMSIFSLHQMTACMVDSLVEWPDFKPFAPRPFGDRPVWVGYDPSRTRDDASAAVIAPPAVAGGKFRLLEKHSWRNMPFDLQAERLKQLTQRFNVQHIGIDVTGIGIGVYDLVVGFFPTARKFSYSPEVKSKLVMKAQAVIYNGRFEYDAGHKEVASAFMAIRKTVTPSGNAITYNAGRTEESGHADLAWAVMHALAFEPLQGQTATNTHVMEIF